eukprot:Nk52_evm1s2270 gene=Nk52_evmTU1s2270
MRSWRKISITSFAGAKGGLCTYYPLCGVNQCKGIGCSGRGGGVHYLLSQRNLSGGRFCSSYVKRSGYEGEKLPSCVSTFSEHNADYFFIGAVHGSKQSAADIKKTIKLVKPDLMILELDSSRRFIEHVSWKSRIGKVWGCIKKGNLIQAFLTAYERKLLTEKADMIDMKMAEETAREVSSPRVVYADRSSLVTLERWLRRIKPEERNEFIKRTILHREKKKGSMDSTSEVLGNECDRAWYEKVVKDASAMERTLSLTAHFVFIHERDLCLVTHLRGAADGWDMVQEGRRKSIVLVAGFAHIRGVRRFMYHDFDDRDLWEVGSKEEWERTDKLWLIENCDIKDGNWLQ